MRVILKDNIKIHTSEIPPTVLSSIESSLTIPNPAKEIAQRELLWGADEMPSHLRLFTYDEDAYMILPIGFRHALEAGCAWMNIEIQYDDQRSMGATLFPGGKQIVLRDYQEPMCDALIRGQCGIGEAPTGAGKTAVTLEAIRRIGRNALIIVDKAALAKQWIDAAAEFLDIEAGYIGESTVKIRSLTVALRQSLHLGFAELAGQGFFDWWAITVVDEAHHASKADTLIDLIQHFSSVYRWGVTATPERDPGYFPVLQAVVGPILWQTTMQDAAEHLMTPRVRVLESKFAYDYEPTRRVQQEDGGTKVKRNNYNSMIKSLCADDERNQMIASAVREDYELGHHILVFSRRKEQLYAIEKYLITVVPWFLTGDQSGDDADEIRAAIARSKRGTVLLSTVADEGLNIPRLDRVVVAYPARNVETMRQIVGRVMRPAERKLDAQIIDVRDGYQPVLRSQFKDRAQLLYGKEGWEIFRT